jgi:hypothetical protein
LVDCSKDHPDSGAEASIGRLDAGYNWLQTATAVAGHATVAPTLMRGAIIASAIQAAWLPRIGREWVDRR